MELYELGYIFEGQKMQDIVNAKGDIKLIWSLPRTKQQAKKLLARARVLANGTNKLNENCV